MVDLHHHLLFGVDDGSKSLEQSIAMVQMAVEDGITHIVATPHANDTWQYDRERNERLLQQLREALPGDIASRVTLGLGCDFHVTLENTADAALHPKRYTINESEYLLIELPDVGIPARLDDVLYKLRLAGMTPILTHPERNATLQRSPDRLKDWIRSGLLLQVTAGSLIGHFGATAETLAWQLLRSNWAHFVATDAHNLDRRPPHMSSARKLVAQRLGETPAERLSATNPAAVFAGQPLPPQPAPLGIFDQPEDDGRDTPWWRRLLRR